MAGSQFLNQLSASIRDDAVETLAALLRTVDGDGEGRELEALEVATRDVVARQDTEFQLNALIAALARIVADQQEQIETLKRTKAAALAKK